MCGAILNYDIDADPAVKMESNVAWVNAINIFKYCSDEGKQTEKSRLSKKCIKNAYVSLLTLVSLLLISTYF